MIEVEEQVMTNPYSRAIVERYAREQGIPQSQIKVVKHRESAIIPDRKVQLLRKIGNAQAEIGRLNKLLNEIRADVLASED